MMTETYVVENGYRERAMTVTDQPPPPQRVLPVSTVQLAAATSDAVITSLGRSPYLLGVVLLVVVGVSATIYFLQLLITGQAFHLNHLTEMQRSQQTELIALHEKEFNALLEMANRLSMAAVVSQPPPSLIAPGSPVLTQPPTREPRR